MNLAAAFADPFTSNRRKSPCSGASGSIPTRTCGANRFWSRSQLQQHFGVKPGDRVGLWLKNCPEFIPSLFGILHAGAVVGAHQQFPQARRGEFHPGRRGH